MHHVGGRAVAFLPVLFVRVAAQQLLVFAFKLLIQPFYGAFGDDLSLSLLPAGHCLQLPQAGEGFHYILRHVPVTTATGEPAESAGLVLAVSKFVQGGGLLFRQTLEVEKFADAGALLAFVFSGAEPGRFGQESILQVLVLLQFGFQGAGVRLPPAEDFLQDGLVLHRSVRELVREEAVGQLLRTVVGVLHQVRE